MQDDYKTILATCMRLKDVVVKKIKYKPRVKLSSLYILVHGQLRRFTEIYTSDKEQEQS